MEIFFQNLYDGFTDDLNHIKQEEDNIINRSLRSLEASMKVLDVLRQKAREKFLDMQSEILFFKEIKPRFQSHQIYHLEILQIEIGKPPGIANDIRKYFENHFSRLREVFDVNIDFYKYWRAGNTHMDKQYFTRGTEILYNDADISYFYGDAEFSTQRDSTLSKLLAYEMLTVYFTEKLEEVTTTSTRPHSASSALSWTLPKANLIEIVYAFQSCGVFNNGEADVRQIADYFQQIFNVNLGNLYRTFQQIRIRKKSRSFFLDQLREKLIERMDYADENPR
jgi:RteC protein